MADDVLRRLARLLEAEVQRSGWAARLGGDEFAVLLPASSLANGYYADKLRDVLPKGLDKQKTEDFIIKACDHYRKYLIRQRERER